MAERGVVAAGHPLTAQAGADVLRAGGNAVDAALAALMTSFMTEPLLTGLGAGGYMLVAPPGGEPVLLDFMVAPRRGDGERAPLDAVVIDFGDAVQVFHIGASSCGVYGMPAGIADGRRALRRPCRWSELAAPAIALARDGIEVNETQALLWDLLGPIAAPTRRVARALLHRRPAAARGRGRARPGARRRDRAPRRRRRRAVLHRRHRDGGLGLGDRAAAGRSRATTSRRTRPSRASPCTSATTAARC